MSTAITASMRINNNLKKIDKAEYGCEMHGGSHEGGVRFRVKWRILADFV